MIGGFCYGPGTFSLNIGSDHPLKGEDLALMPDLFRSIMVDEPKRGIEMVSGPATVDQMAMVHTKAYIDDVVKRAENDRYLTPETPLSRYLLGAHLGIIGGVLRVTEEIADRREGAFISPGGFHHAGIDYGGGFCVFNDVALSARKAQEKGLHRIMIIDTDAHAGNGTMDIFYDDPSVLFVSIHQDPRTLFPGRGNIEENGCGEGIGYTVNIPVPPHSTGRAFDRALKDVILPLAKRYRPDLIIRNGGSDPHRDDPLSDLNVSFMDLYRTAIEVRKIRESTGSLGLDLILSGYGPGKVEGWKALMAGAMGSKYSIEEEVRIERISEKADERAFRTIERIVKELDL